MFTLSRTFLVWLVAGSMTLAAVLCRADDKLGEGGWIYKQYAPTAQAFADFKAGKNTVVAFPVETVKIGDAGPMPVLAQSPKTGDLFCYEMSGPLSRSSDGGKSWQRVSTPPRMMNPAFGVLNDGTLLLGGSWPLTGDLRMTKFRIMRSTDGGNTWDEGSDVNLEDVVLPNGERPVGDFFKAGAGFGGAAPGNLLGAYGRIIELSDGTAVLPFYIEGNSYASPGVVVPTWALLARSRDGGKTWGDVSVVSRDFNEIGFLELPDGELLAVMRGQTTAGHNPQTGGEKWQHLNLHALTGLARSVDKGYTWSRYQIIAGTWQRDEHASDIVRLADGTLIVPTICRMPQFLGRGVPVTVSYDNGVTWSKCHRIAVRVGGAGWFPSSVVLKDDTIVTVDGHPLGGGVYASRWKMPSEMKPLWENEKESCCH